MKAERERLAALRAEEEAARRCDRPVAPKKRADPTVKQERHRVARLQELENKIAVLEADLTEIGRKLENPPADTTLVRKWGNQYAALQKEMDEYLAEWEQLQS